MATEQRRHPRRTSFKTQPPLMVQMGGETLSARLMDSTEGGLGLETARPLGVGARIRVQGEVVTARGIRPIDTDGIVRWVVPGPGAAFLAGVALGQGTSSTGLPDDGEEDYYEVMQLSPNADADTLHRVFRVLAQRFHPDNSETGDEGWFKVLVRAYETLGDPQRRAAYDARRPAREQARWRIFEKAEAARGVEAERRKRRGILAALYVRRANDPSHPGMSVHEIEQLLGCPREHLEFALWFLRENAWVARGDNGRFAITAKGVERAEESGDLPLVGADRMIEAGSSGG